MDARLEPIGIEVRDSRAGIGHEAEKKRKFKEETDQEAKRVKTEEVDFRRRVAKERDDRRNEGLWRGAMNVLEKIEEDSVWDEDEDANQNTAPPQSGSKERHRQPLENINILYRSLVKEREAAEQRRRLKHDLEQSLPRLNDLLGDVKEQFRSSLNDVEDDLDQEDPELAEYEALDPSLRLKRVVYSLREEHCYCFWCKSQYRDARMEGCPGPDEDDHN